MRQTLLDNVRKTIGPFAVPDTIHWWAEHGWKLGDGQTDALSALHSLTYRVVRVRLHASLIGGL